jgi:hypothetical protein
MRRADAFGAVIWRILGPKKVREVGVGLAMVDGRLWAECLKANQRRSSAELYRNHVHPFASRFACPDVARARWRWAPAYFITMARLLCPVIACTSSSDAPAAASCEAAV